MKIPFIKESTLAFWHERKTAENPGLFNWLHGYIYGRWPYFYIGVAMGKRPRTEKWLAPLFWLIGKFHPRETGRRAPTGDPNQKHPTWADSYHGKPILLDEAEKMIRINRPVETALPEKVVPYTIARDIVLKNPERIVALNCPCRTESEDPCKPLDVCLVIGEPFVSFILEHNPDRCRRIDVEEAVRILKAENARGHVAHAFWKEAMLGRFYAICNCCSCCCGAMRAHMLGGTKMLCSSGYEARIDEEKCVNCGICTENCQFKALRMKKGQLKFAPKRCYGCGVCENKCPKDAISLVRVPHRGEPLEVDKILEESRV